MRILFTSLISVVLLGFAFTPDGTTITEDQKSAEKAVLLWADNTFEFYDGSRFENFHTVPSQEQFMLESKIMTLQEFKAEQEESYYSPENKKTKEEFLNGQHQLKRKIDSLNNVLTHLDPHTKNYEIYFWANIKVSNAVTVYYQHLIKIDSKFNVMSARITGKVGTQPDGVKILYKKTATIKSK